MADKKSNFGQKVGAGAAFIGTTGAFLYKGRGSLFTQVTTPTIPISSTLKGPGKSAVQNAFSVYETAAAVHERNRKANLNTLSYFESQIKELAGGKKQGRGIHPKVAEMILREWEAAKQAVLPTGTEILDYDISKGDPFTGIRNAISSSSSVYSNSVFRKFQANIRTMIETNSFIPLSEISASIDPRLASIAGVPQNLFGSQMKSFAQELSGIFNFGITTSHAGMAGSQVFSFAVPGTDIGFDIAQAFGPNEGLVRSGIGMHNIHTPGKFAIMSNGSLSEPMSFTEFKKGQILKAAQSISEAGGTPEEMMRKLSAVSEELDKFADWTQPAVEGQPFTLETLFKANRLTVTDEAGKLISNTQAMELAKVTPGLYPTSTSGRYSTMDPADIYGGFSESIPMNKKPWQYIRNWRPTAEAQEAILAQAQVHGFGNFDFLDSPAAIKQFNGPSGPRLKTLYLSEDQITMLQKMGFPEGIGDGEFLINSRMSEQMQFSKQKRIMVKEINDNILTGGDVSGKILGRSESGELVKADFGTKLIDKQAIPIRGPSGGITAYNLFLEETYKAGTYEKYFGGLKGMGRRMDFNNDFLYALSKATGLHPERLEGFGAIARYSDIEKNPALRQMQQFTGIAMHAEFKNPQGVFKIMQGLGSEAQIDKGLRALAEQQGIYPGTISYNEIFGKENVVGVTRLNYGGPKSGTGAGNLGTIEPRIFSLLQASNEKLANALGQDLVGRILISDPDRLAIHDELKKSLLSMTPGSVAPNAQDITAMDYKELQVFRQRGGYIATGLDEMPTMYIPGYENIGTLAPYKAREQMVEASPMQKTYRSIERTLRSKMSQEEKLRFITGQATQELAQEFAILGKGQGSLARGQIQGSRFLTAVSGKSKFYQSILDQKLDMNTIVGLPEKYALEMFEELRAQGQDVAKQMAAFRSGKPVPGLVARHPLTGPYSLQSVQFMMTDELSPVMYVPETRVGINIPGVGEKSISPGVLAGMGLDKDADIAMAIAVGDDMAKNVSEAMNTGGEAYAHYSIRSQLLKAKAQKLTGEALLTRRQEIAAATNQLGVVDEFVGQVSNKLTLAREAVQASSLNQEAKLRAAGLLDWLENQPISGKHLTSERVLSGAFQDQMNNILFGVSGDAKLLNRTIRDMAAGIDKPIREGLLGKGLELTNEVMFNGQRLKNIRGFELETTTQQIVEATREFKQYKVGDLTAAKRFQYSKPSPSMQLAREQLQDFVNVNDIQRIENVSGMKANVRNAAARINKLASQVASRAKPFVKPLVAGTLAAGAAAALLSGPPETLGSSNTIGRMAGATPTATPSRNSRDDIQPPDFGPSSQPLGSPTVSSQISNRGVMLDENAAMKSKQIRMGLNARNVSASQREQLISRLNSRFPGRLDVRLNDSRRQLNDRTIQDMLE